MELAGNNTLRLQSLSALAPTYLALCQCNARYASLPASEKGLGSTKGMLCQQSDRQTICSTSYMTHKYSLIGFFLSYISHNTTKPIFTAIVFMVVFFQMAVFYLSQDHVVLSLMLRQPKTTHLYRSKLKDVLGDHY